MRVLITGATGLLGKEIVKQLREKDIRIHYLTTSREKIISEENYKGFYWNPDSEYLDPDSFSGVDAIINLAGASIAKKWTRSYKNQILNSRIGTVKTLLKGMETIPGHQVKYIVSASAIGIYPVSETMYYDEENKAVDDSFLGSTVYEWEKAVSGFTRLNIPVGILRIGLVLSEEGGAFPKLLKPVKKYLGATFGNGLQWQSWIHIDDIAGIFVFAVEHTLEGVYNAVAPNPVTQRKLIREIARAAQKPIWLPSVPAWFLKLILGEMSYLLLYGQRVSARKIQETGYSFRYVNISNALENLTKKNVIGNPDFSV